jgi:hypothetical protein
MANLRRAGSPPKLPPSVSVRPQTHLGAARSQSSPLLDVSTEPTLLPATSNRERGKLAQVACFSEKRLSVEKAKVSALKERVASLEADCQIQLRRLGRQDIELKKVCTKNQTLLKVVGALGGSSSSTSGANKDTLNTAVPGTLVASTTHGATAAATAAGYEGEEHPQQHRNLQHALILMGKENQKLIAHLHAVELQAAATRRAVKAGLKRERGLHAVLDEARAMLPPGESALMEQPLLAQPRHAELVKMPSALFDLSEVDDQMARLVQGGEVDAAAMVSATMHSPNH